MSVRGCVLGAVMSAIGLVGCATPTPVVAVFELIPRAPARPPAPAACVVADVVPGSPAAKGGILAGDVLAGMEGIGTLSWGGAFDSFLSSRTAPVRLELRRQGRSVPLDVMSTPGLDPLGVSCDFGESLTVQDEAAVALKDSLRLLARAEVIGPASFIWVRLTNDSRHSLKVGPEMFTASSADWTAINPIRLPDMKELLQALELAKHFSGHAQASYTFGDMLSQLPRIIPIPGAGLGADLLLKNTGLADALDAQTASLSSMRLGGGEAGAALRGASQGLASTWVPSSGDMDKDLAVAANEIARRAAFREALLLPGYSQEGYLYFGQPDMLPLRLSFESGTTRLSLIFDEKRFTMTALQLEAYAMGIPEGSFKKAVLADGRVFDGKIGGFLPRAHAFSTQVIKGGRLVKGRLLVRDIRLLKVAGRNTIIVSP